MKKITINKNDEAPVVMEKIINADADELILSIPRFSRLSESLSNFQLLKREVVALGKKIIIESIDDRIIEFAELSGLKATNPFFTKNKRQFSDIVPQEKLKKEFKSKLETDEDADEVTLPPLDVSPELRKLKIRRLFSMPHFSFPRLRLKLVIVLILLGGAGWFAMTQLPKAEVHIITKKTEWAYTDSIMSDKAAKLNPDTFTIPNQVFSQKKNADLKFAATGKKKVEKRAEGKITIYNSYSSDPQPLVANTRFLSPDGKVFRLAEKITVPAAKIVEGKIVPSNIEAMVIADEPGVDYNIGPVKIFTIPGFKDTPKYQAFYAESKDAMAGGFVGEVAYPTAADISVGKDKVNETLKQNVETELRSQISEGFKIIDGGLQITVLNQTVNENVDKDNQFSIYTEVQATAIAFREADIITMLTGKAEKDKGADFEVIHTNLTYGLARIDAKNGKMSFLVDFKATLRHKVDTEALITRIQGKSEVNLKAAIFALPGLESANISLWPVWVSTVPLKKNRIIVTVD